MVLANGPSDPRRRWILLGLLVSGLCLVGIAIWLAMSLGRTRPPLEGVWEGEQTSLSGSQGSRSFYRIKFLKPGRFQTWRVFLPADKPVPARIPWEKSPVNEYQYTMGNGNSMTVQLVARKYIKYDGTVTDLTNQTEATPEQWHYSDDPQGGLRLTRPFVGRLVEFVLRRTE